MTRTGHRPILPLRAVRAPVLGAAALALAFQGAEGQTVQGRVLDAQSRRPVADALVRLVARSGEGRAATAADSTGRYRLVAEEPGRYRVQAERLGYEAYESEPLEVDSGEVVTLDLRLRPAPVTIRGVEVSADQVNRRVRDFLGQNPALLRVRPIRSTTIDDHARRGNNLPEMIRWIQIANLQVLGSRDGPCYQYRGRGCMPVYLDGARLTRSSPFGLPLEMLSTVVVLLPGEVIAYPAGAVHLFTIGFMR